MLLGPPKDIPPRTVLFTYQRPFPPKQHGMIKWIAKVKTSVKGDLVQSPNNELFVEMECYIESLNKQIKVVLQHVTMLIKRSRQTPVGLAYLGSTLILINSI